MDLTKYTEMHQFTFDEVFDSECTNDEVNQLQDRYIMRERRLYIERC